MLQKERSALMQKHEMTNYDRALAHWEETRKIPIDLRPDHLEEILDAADAAPEGFREAVNQAIVTHL